MGCPEILITDQGREFVNSLSRELYTITKTEHRITSAYHPQTNGLTERFNQTLSQCLAKVLGDNQEDWDEKLSTVLMGYRASRQASTKQSPYFMLFQKRMLLPIDSDILSPDTEGIPEDDPECSIKLMNDLLIAREKAFAAASDNIQKAQKKQKEFYDKKHEVPTLSVGSKVLLENTAQLQRKGGKMDPRWLGPYVVHGYLGKGVYKLATPSGKILKKTANVSRLKCYTERVSSMKTDGEADSPKKRKNEDPADREVPQVSPKKRKNEDPADKKTKKRKV